MKTRNLRNPEQHSVHCRTDCVRAVAWVKDLPEAGPAFYEGPIKRAAEIDAAIRSHVQAIEALDREARRLIGETRAEADKQWTQKEIEAARACR